MASSPAEETARKRSHSFPPEPARTGDLTPLAIADPSSEPAGDAASLTRSAGLVGVGVMGSRLLGLVREMVLAYLFAPGLALDAFYAAFRIPNLLRDLFGEGALSKAFVTTFTDVEVKRGREAAFRLGSQVFNAVLLVVGGLTLIGMLGSEFIVELMLPGQGFDMPLPPGERFGLGDKRELTVHLTRIMFPFILLVSAAAVAMGILTARGRFLAASWASSFFNVGSLTVGVAGYLLAPRLGQHPTVGMAVGVLAGGTLQLLWQVPSLFRAGFRYRAILSFRDPGLRQVARLLGPGLAVAAIVQANVFINSIFASNGAGWLSWISQAFRLLYLPIGLIGVAVSMATLPALTRSIAREDRESFRDTFSYATRLVLLFTIPASVGLIVLSQPIIRLVYERGRFQTVDTEQVAAALTFYALGLTSYAAVKIVTDGFYALQDVRAPLWISLFSMIGNVCLNWLFISVLGMDHRGLALSTSCSVTLSFALLWLLLRQRSGLKQLGGRAAAVMTAKMAVASAAMGAVAWLTCRSLEDWLGNEATLARLLEVVFPMAAALAVLYGACKLLRVREMDQALGALRPSGAGSS